MERNYSDIMHTNPIWLTLRWKVAVKIVGETLTVLDEVLALNGRGLRFSPETPLLGAVPELDSMAVVALLTAFEDRFGVTIHDDDIDAAAFATVGSLVRFLQEKMAA